MTAATHPMDEFLARLTDEIAAKTAAILAEHQPPTDKLLDTAEAADVLGISERQVRSLSAVGKDGEAPRLASVTIGDGARRWRIEDLRAYIASRRVASRSEVEEDRGSDA